MFVLFHDKNKKTITIIKYEKKIHNKKKYCLKKYSIKIVSIISYEMKATGPQGTYTITGLANIGATCTLRGVSINKDYGQYATIETSAHEIGHK